MRCQWANSIAVPARASPETSRFSRKTVIKTFPKQRYLDEPSRVIWREQAQAASSDADFLAKMRIALREIREARVAIRIIVACELAAHAAVGGYEDEARQVAVIFASIIVNKQTHMRRKNREPDS